MTGYIDTTLMSRLAIVLLRTIVACTTDRVVTDQLPNHYFDQKDPAPYRSQMTYHNRDGFSIVPHFCYSCMSGFYEDHWNNLKHLYNKPKNFTDLCDNPKLTRKPLKLGNVGVVECVTACVTIEERSQIGGVYILGYMRGCYNSMMRRGFNAQYVMPPTDDEPRCRTYQKRKAFRLNYQFPDGPITMCLCNPSRCNAFAVQQACGRHAVAWLLAASLALLIAQQTLQQLLFTS